MSQPNSNRTEVSSVDPVELTSQLIRCASVTPEEGGALTLLTSVLATAGFTCTRVDRNGTPNLYARWGHRGANRTLGFNGHTDVVPTGDPALWERPPFSGEIDGGRIWGRGACDMKSGVAAFVAAAVDFVRNTPPEGAIVLAITGDEEGPATDGTVALLDWMADNGEAMSHCLVGEPTCPKVMGEMIKNGRRGSMSVFLTVNGKQGHAAYPHRALNPLPILVAMLHKLGSEPMDAGSENFDPSTFTITTIDTGNPATNVIPPVAKACVNIRFNDLHSGESVSQWIRDEVARVEAETGASIDMRIKISGESFVTDPGWFTDLVARAVETETGVTPQLSTSGGTSDARFIRAHCPVVEFGLVGSSMHEVNEFVEVEQVRQLKAVYSRLIQDYFASER